MKIAIISDTHDNIPNLEKCLSFLKKEGIKTLIHCGDVTTGETLKKLREKFEGKIFLSFGNMEINETFSDIKDLKDIEIFEEFGKLEIDNLKIGFCHMLNLAHQKCQEENFDFIFHGHTHKPWLEKIKKCVIANPGNIAGLFYKPTFAILETKDKKISLIILEKI